MPNAAVDLPFISPVWTASSGRLRRCRVLSPSSGTTSTLPWGISGDLPWRCLTDLADRRRERVGCQLLQAEGLRSEVDTQGGGQPEPDRPGLAVDDDARC